MVIPILFNIDLKFLSIEIKKEGREGGSEEGKKECVIKSERENYHYLPDDMIKYLENPKYQLKNL